MSKPIVLKCAPSKWSDVLPDERVFREDDGCMLPGIKNWKEWFEPCDRKPPYYMDADTEVWQECPMPDTDKIHCGKCFPERPKQ